MKDLNEISEMLGRVSGSPNEMVEQLKDVEKALSEREVVHTRYFNHLKSLETIWRAMLEGRLTRSKEDLDLVHFRAVTELSQFIDFDESKGEIASLVIGGMLHLMALDDDDE